MWHGDPGGGGGGKSEASSPYKLTVVAFGLEGATLPQFRVFPEGRASRFTDALLRGAEQVALEFREVSGDNTTA